MRAQVPSATEDGSAPSLEVKDLCKTFRTAAGDKEVLRGVSLRVRPGEWVCVMGRSGSGKSTLLRCA